MMQALQAQLNQTSRNSSRPPSSDPHHSERPRRPRSTRRRGGQPGHPGHTRTLVPVDDVDAVVVIKPAQCTHCQAPLSGEDPKPWRHQVIELPPIKPIITEYQWHQLVCAACGVITRAPWPKGVPSGTYGPRVHATVALWSGAYRLSKRMTAQVMDDLFGVPMSVGTISQSEQTTTAVLADPVEEVKDPRRKRRGFEGQNLFKQRQLRVSSLLKTMLLDGAADHLRRDLVPSRTSTRAIFPEFSAPQAPLDARELTKDDPGAQTLEPRDDLRDGVPWREGAKEMDMIRTHLHLFNGDVILLRNIDKEFPDPLLDLAL